MNHRRGETARCKFCGAEGLTWEQKEAWDLMEPDGNYHECKPEDRRKEMDRVLEQKALTDEATRKYREANGYL